MSITDDFHRANAIPPTPSAQGWAWNRLFGSGPYAIISNTLWGPAASALLVAESDLGASDMTVQGIIDQIDDNFGVGAVAARVNHSTGDCYYAGYVRGFNVWFIGKLVGGVFTYNAVNTLSADVPEFPFTVDFRVTGTSLRLDVNGSTMLSGTDSSISAGTYSGVVASANSISTIYTSFTATALTLPPAKDLTPLSITVQASGDETVVVFPEACNWYAGTAILAATPLIGSTVARQCLTLDAAPISGDGTATHRYATPGRACYVNETVTMTLPSDFVLAVSDGAPNLSVPTAATTNASTYTAEPAVNLARAWWETISTTTYAFEVDAWGFIGPINGGLTSVGVDVTDGTHTVSGSAVVRTASPLDGWPIYLIEVTGIIGLDDGAITVTPWAISNAGQGTAYGTARTYYNNCRGGLAAKSITVYWDPDAATDGGTGLTVGSPKKLCWSAVRAGIGALGSITDAILLVIGTNSSSSYNPRTGYDGNDPQAARVTFQPLSGNRADMRIVYSPSAAAIQSNINAHQRYFSCTMDVSKGGTTSYYMAAITEEPVLKGCLVEFGPGGNKAPHTFQAQWGGVIAESVDCVGSLCGPCGGPLARNVTVDSPSGDVLNSNTGCSINVRVTDRCIGGLMGTVLYAGSGAATISWDGNQDTRRGTFIATDQAGSLSIPCGSFTLTSVNTGAKTMRFDGEDLRTYFTTGDTIRIDFNAPTIEDPTADILNGTYTLSGPVTYSSGNSTVPVVQSIPTSTVNGGIGAVMWSSLVTKLNARSGWTATLVDDTWPAGAWNPMTKSATHVLSVRAAWGPHSDLFQMLGDFENVIFDGIVERPFDNTYVFGTSNSQQIAWLDHDPAPISFRRCVFANIASPLCDARSGLHRDYDTVLFAFCTWPVNDLDPIQTGFVPITVKNLFLAHSMWDSIFCEGFDIFPPPLNPLIIQVQNIHCVQEGTFSADDVLGELTLGPAADEIVDPNLPAPNLRPLSGGQLVNRVTGLQGFPDAAGNQRRALSAIGAYEQSGNPPTRMLFAFT